MNLKYLKSSLAILAGAASAQAAVSFTGNAFSNVPGIEVGDVGFLIFDNNPLDSQGFSSITFTVGSNLLANSTYGNFTVATNSGTPTSKSAILFGSNINISGAFSQIDISVDSATTVDQGDTFAWVVFKNSTTTALNGDTFQIYTHSSWVVPPDGNYSFAAAPTGANFQQVNSTNAPSLLLSSGTIGSAIPEPSSFAALAGLGMLGFAALRKRRSA